MATEVKKPKDEDLRKAQSIAEVEEEALGPKKPGDKKDKKKDKKEKKAAPKSVGKLELAVLISLLWLSIIAAAVILLLFDPTDGKVIRGMALLYLNPEEETRESYWIADILELQDWRKELDEYSTALDAWDQELSAREGELDDRESIIDDMQDEVEALLEALRESGAAGGEVVPDVTQMAKLLETMPAAEAARTLEGGVDYDNILRICQLISPKKLAPIMSAMDVELRAEIVNDLSMPPETEEDW